MKLSSWPEIGSDGDVLLTPYVPKGITGYDDDDVPRIPKNNTALFEDSKTSLVFLIITMKFIYIRPIVYTKIQSLHKVNKIRFH